MFICSSEMRYCERLFISEDKKLDASVAMFRNRKKMDFHKLLILSLCLCSGRFTIINHWLLHHHHCDCQNHEYCQSLHCHCHHCCRCHQHHHHNCHHNHCCYHCHHQYHHHYHHHHLIQITVPKGIFIFWLVYSGKVLNKCLNYCDYIIIIMF